MHAPFPKTGRPGLSPISQGAVPGNPSRPSLGLSPAQVPIWARIAPCLGPQRYLLAREKPDNLLSPVRQLHIAEHLMPGNVPARIQPGGARCRRVPAESRDCRRRRGLTTGVANHPCPAASRAAASGLRPAAIHRSACVPTFWVPCRGRSPTAWLSAAELAVFPACNLPGQSAPKHHGTAFSSTTHPSRVVTSLADIMDARVTA